MGLFWWLRGVAFIGFSHAMLMVCVSLDDTFAGLGGAVEIIYYMGAVCGVQTTRGCVVVTAVLLLVAVDVAAAAVVNVVIAVAVV